MWTRQRLLDHVAAGGSVDYLFFWGHTPKRPGVVDASCLSQWYPAAFAIDGVEYDTAEHFMMAEKARLFGDADVLAEILAADSPAEAKALGRRVRGYDDHRWAQARSAAVVRGNVAKFSQNEHVRAFLESTGNRILVEASPRDRIWGIGMGASSPDARDPGRWRGENLLGFALMDVREQLE
jgi:ribA/ribD-fused uncharacterized protein